MRILALSLITMVVETPPAPTALLFHFFLSLSLLGTYEYFISFVKIFFKKWLDILTGNSLALYFLKILLVKKIYFVKSCQPSPELYQADVWANSLDICPTFVWILFTNNQLSSLTRH